MNAKTGKSDAAASPPLWNAMPGSIGNPPENPLKKRKDVAAPLPDPEASQSEVTVGDYVTSETSSPLAFYRFQDQDLGLTAEQVETRLKGEKVEMSSFEEQVLDGLLFGGYYEHQFKVGKRHTFSLRSIGTATMHNTPILLSKISKNDPSLDGRTTNALEGAIAVARMLSEYGGKPTCVFQTQAEFESLEALEQRLTVVMAIPLAVANAIGDRSNAFVNIIREAVRRDTSNFS